MILMEDEKNHRNIRIFDGNSGHGAQNTLTITGVTVPKSGVYETGETVVYLNLREGENTITFGNDDSYAPDLDVIAVKKESEK